MEAEQVVSKILADGRAEAEKIIADAQAKISAEQSKVDAELKEYRSETDKLAVDAAEDKRARMLATARMANGKAYLAAKGKLLDKVFAKARETINDLPDDQYLNLMTKLMLKAVQTGDEQIVVGVDELRINDSTVKKINRQLGSGFKGNLKLSSERADIDGGFILRRGNIQINASTEVLIEQLREEMESEIAAEMFA